MSLFKWSQTAADNDDADSTINWAEGMAPSAVNNSSRAEMAAVAKARDDWAGALTTGGTTTAYTLTSNQVFDTLANMSGERLTVRFNATNGAAPTLNVDGLGAKAIQTASGTAVGSGELLADSVWQLTYDNSIPAWLLNGYTSLKITGLTALTAPAIDDEIPIYDLSATTNKKITTTDLFEIINVFTEDSAPHVSNDFLVTYDASASTVKKLTLTNLAAALTSVAVSAKNTSKAFASFLVSGTSVTFTAGNFYNVATITRSSEGVFAVTFTAALPTANYVVHGTGFVEGASTSALLCYATDKLTTGFTLNCFNLNGNTSLNDPGLCDFSVFGF